MTTDITDIYTALLARLATLLPSHARLSNVHDLAQNSEQFLRLGYGVLMGEAENTRRSLSKQSSTRRAIVIHLTRKVVARELAASTKGDTDLALLEDLQLLIDEAGANFTLSAGTHNFEYVSDTGIQHVHAGKENFISVSASFTVEYFRNL